MKNLIGAAVLAASTAVAGAAMANDTLEATFGNTVTVSAEDGTVLATYLMDAGNTYNMTTAEGSVSGTWRVNDDGQVCLTPEGGEEGCNTLAEGKGVGDTWTVEGDDGNITIAITEGQ